MSACKTYYETVRRNFRFSQPDLAVQAEAVKNAARSRQRRKAAGSEAECISSSWRFCVDYRRRNAVTRKDSYPLPRIDDALDHISGSRWFSSLDLRSGHWQVEQAPDTVQVGPEVPQSRDDGKELLACDAVIPPCFIQSTAVVCNHLLSAVSWLRQDGADAHLAGICVQDEWPVRVGIAPHSLAIVLSRVGEDSPEVTEGEKPQRHHHHTGYEIFADFKDENMQHFWNKKVTDAISDTFFLGWIDEHVLLIQGKEDHLEVLREGWMRRALKPPRGFDIKYLDC
ncbi:hypothetical protein AAFF_G00358320 [Aldrovandia affinis]|uniref:Reverse transcriptase n=1 Tax=Aldrovandia affinis TaxID=143900 RepID=A0AAD7T8V2_9TELE|nr:hypothetical protein AAFF_G00358320 [Aldrovandia affinis]